MPDEEDESFDASPISSNQLHNLSKEITPENVQVKRDGSNYLAEHLRATAEAVIETAEENRIEQDDKRLQRKHIRGAVKEAFSEYNMMDEFIALIEQYEYELKQEAASTKMLEFDDISDE